MSVLCPAPYGPLLVSTITAAPPIPVSDSP